MKVAILFLLSFFLTPSMVAGGTRSGGRVKGGAPRWPDGEQGRGNCKVQKGVINVAANDDDCPMDGTPCHPGSVGSSGSKGSKRPAKTPSKGHRDCQRAPGEEEWEAADGGVKGAKKARGARRVLTQASHHLRKTDGRELADAALLETFSTLIADMRANATAIDSFEIDMEALSILVNGTALDAIDASALQSTVEAHQAALTTIRKDLSTIQATYFSVVAELETEVNNANAEVDNIQDAMAVATSDSELIQHLVSIVGWQQEASYLEDVKEEIETLVQILAIRVDNLVDYDDVLAMFLALSGDANVTEDEVCIYDPYGDCTFSNGYCDDGYYFFATTLTKAKTIPLSSTPSAITVSIVSTCGHHFGNDGFDIYFNNVAVGTIFEGTHCTCGPPILALAITDFAGQIPAGSTSFELKIVSRNSQGYIAEAFAQILYDVIA